MDTTIFQNVLKKIKKGKAYVPYPSEEVYDADVQ